MHTPADSIRLTPHADPQWTRSCSTRTTSNSFSCASPYLFGLILDHYLARQVSSHSFTQTELRSVQRGVIARWPVRMGTRGVA
ncbi:hypothetical protein BURKHO8Y_210249 [Burkholderia sp. 8Y]|uniref:type VI secretion system baseplate subunit TssF n=1 Tax=Burkholderia sp. 8Y TaxID=2653133 RepID=UPI0012F2F8E4|nr:type VI secretion system baseplate subunit TssF [Burkholderia sp. 8Y]VXC32335.1 hypothetical protein BURKHO8Y_210249 [Burkholderia sp. 8Y]